jgi:chemotaxis family two-component system sensor kinase Cph1
VSYSLLEAKIKPGEHLCSFYENKEEQFQIAFPFIVEGLARNEKCLYIADENSVDEIKAGLLIHGIDVEKCLKTGQLNIRTTKESYLKGGRFILNDMILQIDSFVYRAINEGYSGARVTGEVTWLIRELSFLEDFFEYEKTLNEVFRNRRVKLLCQYNSKKLFGNVILRALRTHPRVLIGLGLYENVYYERTKPIKRRKKANN